VSSFEAAKSNDFDWFYRSRRVSAAIVFLANLPPRFLGFR
jgi:hypothetical protein